MSIGIAGKSASGAAGAEMDLERFAANLAHEIRNPLSNIQLSASLLERELGETSTARDLAMRISSGIKRLDRLVSGLLSFTVTPRTTLHPLNVSAVVTDGLGFIRFWVEENGIALSVVVPDRPAVISGDHDQLQQVLLNLILNAVEAIQDHPNQKHGKIEVRIRVRRHAVILSVTDNGCGIPPQLRGEILRPFFTTKERGTGIGLSIVQSIVARHGATLRFTSSPKRGTSFEVEFKAAE